MSSRDDEITLKETIIRKVERIYDAFELLMQRKAFGKRLYDVKLIPHQFQPMILHFPSEIVDSSGPKHRGRFVVAAK